MWRRDVASSIASVGNTVHDKNHCVGQFADTAARLGREILINSLNHSRASMLGCS